MDNESRIPLSLNSVSAVKLAGFSPGRKFSRIKSLIMFCIWLIRIPIFVEVDDIDIYVLSGTLTACSKI